MSAEIFSILRAEVGVGGERTKACGCRVIGLGNCGCDSADTGAVRVEVGPPGMAMEIPAGEAIHNPLVANPQPVLISIWRRGLDVHAQGGGQVVSWAAIHLLPGYSLVAQSDPGLSVQVLAMGAHAVWLSGGVKCPTTSTTTAHSPSSR